MNQQIYEVAADWLVELRVGELDAAARARLDAWFRLSPEHIRAFLELSNIWEEGAEKGLSADLSTHALIARARAAGTNVVTLSTPPKAASASKTAQPRARQITRKMQPSGPIGRGHYRLAVSLVFFLLLAGAVALYRFPGSTYTTGIGEQRAITLADGSTIELSPRSKIRVHFSKGERDIELLAGHALFKVAKDPGRPFIVGSDEARVRAVGTEFDVYRKTSDTTVTVLEGRVMVLAASSRDPSSPPIAADISAQMRANEDAQRGYAVPANLPFPGVSPGVLVSAGEQVIISAQQVSSPQKANTAAVAAWTRRELVFGKTPLTDVAAEFNLYNEKSLIISDPTLKDFHVTGVFSSTNPSSLLEFLRAQEGIRVRETPRAIFIARQ